MEAQVRQSLNVLGNVLLNSDITSFLDQNARWFA